MLLDISKDYVGHVLHEILGMRNLLARWMPRLITLDNKRSRETTSEQCLMLFKCNLEEFLHLLLSIDRRNMESLEHTRNQETVDTVNFT